MNYIYLILNILTFGSTFLLSYHKKLQFNKYFREVFIAIGVVGFAFVLWDYVFTTSGVWGFNQVYLIGLSIANLPIEEIMFFVSVPFALLFCYQLILKYQIGKSIQVKYLKIIPVFLFVLQITLILSLNIYPLFVSFLTIVALVFSYKDIQKYRYFWVTYLVSLVPFFVFNTILTHGVSYVSSDPIVWYNPESITNLRIGSIPIEDLFYQFVMLFLLTFVFNGVGRNIKKN